MTTPTLIETPDSQVDRYIARAIARTHFHQSTTIDWVKEIMRSNHHHQRQRQQQRSSGYCARAKSRLSVVIVVTVVSSLWWLSPCASLVANAAEVEEATENNVLCTEDQTVCASAFPSWSIQYYANIHLTDESRQTQTVLGAKSANDLSLVSVQRPLCTDCKRIIQHLNQSVYNEAFVARKATWSELRRYRLRTRDTLRRLTLNCQHRFVVLQPGVDGWLKLASLSSWFGDFNVVEPNALSADWTLYLLDDRNFVTNGQRNTARLAVYRVDSSLLCRDLLSGAVTAAFEQWLHAYQPTAYSVETVTPYTNLRVKAPSIVDTFVREVRWEPSPPIQETPWCRSDKFLRST